ncbi:MAG: mechanosensitive ion channel [Bacteroidota bacterium]|nr:mechanosensitive ion channel [Bacteroidota bacterium]
MKIFQLFILFISLYSAVAAQDTTKLTSRSFDTSLFANDDTLTRNDYLIGIGKVYETLNKSTVISQSVPVIIAINHQMDEDDSALNIIKARLAPTSRIQNIRSIQMFATLLDQLNDDTKKYSDKLNQFDKGLDVIKTEIFQLREKDTVVRRIFRNPLLMATFKDQLFQLRAKWRTADSLIKKVNHSIDNSLARASANLIAVEELQNYAEALLKTTGLRIFGKEGKYLWEPHQSNISSSVVNEYKKSIADEKKITQYYFAHTRNQIYLLIVLGLIFFYWIFYNFRSLRHINKLDGLKDLHFHFVDKFPAFASLIFMLNLAPLFDLNAPQIYIETIVVLLMATLTAYFWKHLLKSLFYWWILFEIIFLLLLFSRLSGLPFYLQRWWILILNGASFVLASFVLLQFRKHYNQYKIFFITAGIYILFNLLAFACNLFGRITLTNIFGSTSIFAFVEMTGLTIFIQTVKEAFLLQIQSSRLRKNYPDSFEYEKIAMGILRLLRLLAVITWLAVFTSNLNIYSAITDDIMNVLTTSRNLGSFSFTFRGVILFLLIIWCANFLQKYIAYFFGDIGDDTSFDNKGQRSRLLITRLVLLTAGFLLAVAASGLPVDKITVILGALGVGIGLGLQSIVNNFVSGIILIFDRPLRIGDTVEIGDKKGRVKEISVRSSTLLTPDGAEVIIPNGDILSHNIVNWTLSNNHIRVDVTFTIDKLINSEDIRADITKIIQSLTGALVQKEPEILVNNITSQSAQLKIFFWCKEITKIDYVRSDAYAAIYKYLQGKEIKILS